MQNGAVALMDFEVIVRKFFSQAAHKSIALYFGYDRSTSNENIFLISFYYRFLLFVLGWCLKQPIEPNCQGASLTLLEAAGDAFFDCLGDSPFVDNNV